MQVVSQIVEVNCRAVRKELVSYMEGDLSLSLRTVIDKHLHDCSHCHALYDSSRNIALLLSGNTVFQLPQGFSHRLCDRLLTLAR